MTDNAFVSIGLVTWNSAGTLDSNLESLTDQNYPDLKLVVVDNASTDTSRAKIRSYFPTATIIRNDTNLGFCHAHNQAIRASTGKYYLALNPDVIMLPNYISSLVEALEQHPQCGSVAGKLWQSSENDGYKIIDTTGLFLNRHRRQYLRGHGEIDRGQYDSPGEIFGVDGAAPLYRREMLEDIRINNQYFDELFFAHKEDVDLAWRAKLFGWRCWYSPRAHAIHPRSFRPGSRMPLSAEIRTLAVKNRYLLLIKNESHSTWRRDMLRILSYDLQILSYILLFERKSLAAIRLLRDQIPLAKAWREQIWDRVKVSPEEIRSWFI